MSEQRVSDDKLAFLIEHGGLDCTKEAQAVAGGIMRDLRDLRAEHTALRAEFETCVRALREAWDTGIPDHDDECPEDDTCECKEFIRFWGILDGPLATKVKVDR